MKKKFKYTDRDRPLLPVEKEILRNTIYAMEQRERDYIFELLLPQKENQDNEKK